MASALADAGAKVAIRRRSAERGGERVELIKKAGGQAAFFAADALDKQQLTAARDASNHNWDQSRS